MRQEWSPDELVAAWTLVDGGLAVGGQQDRGDPRLGFTVLLKFFEIEARFPQHPAEVPRAAVIYVAEQVKVAAEEFAGYSWSSRSIKYHPVSRSAPRSGSGNSREVTRTSSPGGWPRKSARSSSLTTPCARRCWCAAAPNASSRPVGSGGSKHGAFRIPGAPAQAPLSHLMCHVEDIYRPLGIRHRPDSVSADVVLDQLVSPRGRGTVNPGLLDGFHWTDTNWNFGEGAPITGSASALITTLIGRPAALDELSGEGAARVRACFER